MMGTRFLSKNSGDWSQLRGDASSQKAAQQGEESNAADSAEDDFVQV